ncbi:FxLYD domain-containing protein [Streptomyces sp. NPDC020298]|uniref:FxLYD domain-containing protein n=1 Tax=unclassified Streptomyces TaxID=2593676 RepID=UPI0033E4D5EB
MTGLTATRTGAVLTLVTCLGAGLSGCSNGNGSSSPTSAVSKAASFASQGASALASATAEAGNKLNEVKNGVNAKDAVTLGTPASTSDGHMSVDLTAVNKASSTKSFAVQVNFTDSSGNLLDTTVATVSNVAAGKSGKATAQSHRKLTGQVKTVVARALRY